MSFINPDRFKIVDQLKRNHLVFPRAEELKTAFTKCLEYQFISQKNDCVEARGLVVTGNSRVGKSRELKKLIGDFNASKTQMPDGRPAKIVSCVLSGRVSFKDLGVKTLSALGYEVQRARTQEYIWERVLDQAQGQGVVGIHYDECQHVFAAGAKSNAVFLDSFKSMMKEPRWPLMLILSGVPTLFEYVRSYEQLDALVDPVHFDEIRLKRDKEELRELLFAYADEAEIDIFQLVTMEFLSRLDFACAHRWGLVIELLIDTLTKAKLEGKSELKLEDFAEQFALRTGTTKQYSPFTEPDYVEAFDAQRMLKLGE